MTRRRIIRVILGVVAAMIVLVGVGLGIDDSHRTNAKYLLWKHHLWPYSRNLALRYFNVDSAFRRSLDGKTKAEVQRWFPVLTPLNPNDHRLPYLSGNLVRTPGFVWIDGTNWGIIFVGDRVKDIVLIKG